MTQLKHHQPDYITFLVEIIKYKSSEEILRLILKEELSTEKNSLQKQRLN